MNKKQIIRFLKKVTVYNLFMATVVTIWTLLICHISQTITGAIVTPLCALWGIELALSALIKIVENKTIKGKKDNTESEDYP